MARPFQRKPKSIGIDIIDHFVALAAFALIAFVTVALGAVGLGAYALCKLGGFL